MDEQEELEQIHQYQDFLGRLGYSKPLLGKRIPIYDNAAKCLARVTNRNWFENIDVIVAGSRGEGMSNSILSDLDVIMIQPAVKCYHISSTANTTNDDTQQYVCTFELVQQDVPHGYVKLRLRHKKDSGEYYRLCNKIDYALTYQNYLRSKNTRFIGAIENDGEGLLKEGWLSENYQHQIATGPAQPLKYPLPFNGIHLPIDYVQAFICIFPSFFDEWCERVKMKTWP